MQVIERANFDRTDEGAKNVSKPIIESTSRGGTEELKFYRTGMEKVTTLHDGDHIYLLIALKRSPNTGGIIGQPYKFRIRTEA